ncbi:MAG TPA: hypothetical protein VF681_00845 [Abditibacteriaceae bacterium]|jgi:hypothetical protein
MKSQISRRFSVAAFALVLSGAAFQSVQAATLEHKWRAGEQLAYDVALDGTMTVETDASAPILFAGIPLDVKLNGNAALNLDTREVATDGGAVVALSFPRVQLKGSAWEQNLVLDANAGEMTFTFNGQKNAKTTPVPWLVNPNYALLVSKNAKIERIVSLKTPEETAATPEPKTGLPVNVAGLMRSMALQLFPALWPNREVAPGETWSVESRLPVPAANAADRPALELLPLGKFDLTLGNEEEVNGKRAYRVAMQGLLDLDKAKAARLNPAGKGTRLSSGSQKVTGIFWFDAAAGQVVRADLKLGGDLAGIISSPAKNPGDTPTSFAASERFNGTLTFNLKSTSMKATN